MERYKSIFSKINILKDDILVEMSLKRKAVLLRISNLLPSLIGHLIMIEELGKKDINYKKHQGEIEIIKKRILKANQIKQTNKKWLSVDSLILLFDDGVDNGIYFFKDKYPRKKILKNYNSIDDFPHFTFY